jgi:tRNA 2-thiouridine synthesizing protein A
MSGDKVELDVRGLLCPLPVLKAAKRLKSLATGDLLTVTASDPAAVIDFPHYCNETGHELVSHSKEGDELVFVIRKTHGK